MAYEAEYLKYGDTVTYTPGSAVDAGDVIVQGELLAVAKGDIAASEQGVLSRVGTYTVAKEGGGGVTFAAGAIVYWDDTAKLAVATDGGGANKRMGLASLAAADADTSVVVVLGA